MKVKIVTFVPIDYADTVRTALGNAGSGVIGDYTYCSFSVVGTGRYKSSDTSHPFIGKPGQLEEAQEERIEVVCDRTYAKKVLQALRKVHPYEEVAFDIYPLLDESEL